MDEKTIRHKIFTTTNLTKYFLVPNTILGKFKLINTLINTLILHIINADFWIAIFLNSFSNDFRENFTSEKLAVYLCFFSQKMKGHHLLFVFAIVVLFAAKKYILLNLLQ